MIIEKSDKASIMIVDDNVTNLHVLIDYLNKAGFRILIAQNGETALRRIDFVRPDVILLDIIMPGIDGFETCRRLKENKETRDIPVIFMTARSAAADKVRGFRLGAAAYITKPFDQKEVLSCILKQLGMQEQRKERPESDTGQTASGIQDRETLSVVVHNMRKALSDLVGFSGSIAELSSTFSKEESEFFFKEISGCTRDAFSRLENLLDRAEFHSETRIPQPESFDLHPLLLRNISAFQKHAEEKEIRITHAAKSEFYVYADPNMTNIILRNLISNAVHFTPAHGEVNISAKTTDETVEITISDMGSDIETSGEEGFAHGMMLCKELVEKNNGTFLLESEVGKGMTLFFSLPKGKKEEYTGPSSGMETESSETVTEPSRDPGKLKAGPRLLVAEDNIINQQMLLLLLEKQGFDVSAVSNGKEAVQALETISYDLVLMDIEMPEMTGIEATRAIRDSQTRVLDHQIPIVAVTAHTEKESCEEYIKAGMNDCISKPVKPDELFGVIRKLLPGENFSGSEPAEPVKVTVSGKKIFDREELLSRVGGNEEICRHIAKLFAEGMSDQIEKLKNALNQKDADQTKLQAHAMKGMSANISAHRLYDVTSEIESAGKKNELDNARLLIKTLEDEFDKCRSALNDSGLL